MPRTPPAERGWLRSGTVPELVSPVSGTAFRKARPLADGMSGKRGERRMGTRILTAALAVVALGAAGGCAAGDAGDAAAPAPAATRAAPGPVPSGAARAVPPAPAAGTPPGGVG